MRFLLALLVASINSSVFAQSIRYVAANGTNTNPATATSWAMATADVQGAINASSSGQQVWIAGGVYKPGGPTNADRTISFSLKSGVVVYGGFAGTETALNQRPVTTPSSTTLSGNIGNPNRLD